MKYMEIDDRDEDLRLLRIGQVLELVPVARSSLYRGIDTGDFPAPIKLNGASLWVSDEIRRWKRERCSARGDAPARQRHNEDVI